MPTGQATSTMPMPMAACRTLSAAQLGNNTLPTMQLGNPTHYVLPQQPSAASTLPPVPAQLHQQFVQDEYVDFSVLLNKTGFMDTTGQPSSSQQPNVTKISSFATWMETWNIY